jgi:hypothetical protein
MQPTMRMHGWLNYRQKVQNFGLFFGLFFGILLKLFLEFLGIF